MRRFTSGAVLLVMGMLALAGCGDGSFSNIEAEKQRWTAQGWQYFETFGTPASDASYAAQMSSSTARSTTAFASVAGNSTKRVYEQTNALYLVVSMQRPGGDTFALVFEKPKN